MAVGRVAALSTAFALCLLVALANPVAATAAGSGCAPRCGGDLQVVPRLPRSGATPCLHDPGCGGGLALGLGTVTPVVVAVAVAPLALCLLAGRRTWFTGSRQPQGRTPAGWLFRPPRVLLDV